MQLKSRGIYQDVSIFFYQNVSIYIIKSASV